MADSDTQALNTAGESPSPWCRCVVMAGQGRPAPARLLSILRERGVQVKVVADPPGVMVELAEGRPQVLIVNEPQCSRRLPELLAAMRSYYPRTRCWQYQNDAAGRARLTPIGGAAARIAMDAGGRGNGSSTHAKASGRLGRLGGDPGDPQIVIMPAGRNGQTGEHAAQPAAVPAAPPVVRTAPDLSPAESVFKESGAEGATVPAPAPGGQARHEPGNGAVRQEGWRELEGPDPIIPSPLITPEELAMLLGDDGPTDREEEGT